MPTENRIRLEGRRAVITGAARGIGYAIAERMVRSGASVSIWDRDEEAGKSARDALSARVISDDQKVSSVAPELTDAGAIAEAAQKTSADLEGAPDILVNNAGIAGMTDRFWKLDPDKWREVIEIDLVAPFLTARALVPGMIEGGYGRVVNIASIAGKEGNPNASHYSAAKAGLIGLTKSMGKELAETGVLVNCVTPAVIETEILNQITQEHIDYMRSKIPMGRFGKVEEAAAMVAWLVSEELSFSAGAVFDLSGGRATY